MKHLLLIIFIALISFTVKAQQSSPQTSDEKAYAAVEREPSFPGGQEAFVKFLIKNIKSTGDIGTVYVTFVVEKDGSLSGIQVIKHVSERADKMAFDAISKSPDWKPGTQNGKAVRVQYTVPIKFS